MSFSKHLAGAAVAVAVLVIGASVQAKGPKGGGHEAGPAHSANDPHGIGSNTWDTPPGWSKGEKDGWGDSTTPPGWDSNTTGQEHGWDTKTLPPGIEKRQSN